ncbi:MAG: serine hydrolase [Bacteroidales bacterium]
MQTHNEDTHSPASKGEGRDRNPQLPVILSLSTALLLMLGIILYPLMRHMTEEPLLIPMAGIDGVWADSVFNRMSGECRLFQTVMLEADPEDSAATGNGQFSCIPGGMQLNPDSAHLSKSFAQWAEGLPLPLFTLIRNGDSLPEVMTPLSAEALMSIRSDSLIEQYLTVHISTMKMTGANMVQYPLWTDRRHTALMPDTLYLKRQIKLSAHFTAKALSAGMIPVLPLPDAALRNGIPKSQLDSTVSTLLKTMIHEGLPAIMLDSVPASLRENQGVRYFLKKTYGFTGLIIIKPGNNLNGNIASLYYSGADILMLSREVLAGIDKKSAEFMTDRENNYLIGRASHKVLYFKEWIRNRKGESRGTMERALTMVERMAFQFQLEEKGIIRFRDTLGLIPFQQSGAVSYLIHLPENMGFGTFQEYFGFYADFRVRSYRRPGNIKLDPGSVNIVIAMSGSARMGQWYEIAGIAEGRTAMRTVLIHLGRVDSLVALQALPAVIHAGQHTERTEMLLANMLFGGAGCDGVLPWDISRNLPIHTGMVTSGRVRLGYTIPEVAGIASQDLTGIDSIVSEAIRNAAFPGCQVFIALRGQVIYHRSFGETFYGSGKPVTNDHLYDIASVTKSAATTLAMMRMVDQKKMSLRDPLGRYFKDHTATERDAVTDTLIRYDTIVVKGTRTMKEQVLQAYGYFELINDTLYSIIDTIFFTSTRTRNVFRLTMSQLLTHRSGLPPALPIGPFISTFDRKAGINRFREYYSPVFLRDTATIQVAEGMFLFNHYFDTLWARCRAVGVNPAAEYVYSDANMVFVQQAIDSVNRKPLSQFLDQEFFRPLGLRHCTFNPLKKFPTDLVVPTANDLRWRKQQVHGYVHDPTAALFGGIAGNAGLFSNAADLGVLHQMVLQGGAYGGKRYLSEATVELFTARQPDGHRALGFDMNSGEKTIIAPSASPNSYGHTGFTGTCVWVDPDLELVYIFLSNRVYPNTENYKINFLKVRQAVQQVVYDALAAEEARRAPVDDTNSFNLP